MRIVGPAVLAAFPGRILNTHPSLLPAFPGAHAVADALAHGVDRDRLHRPPRRRDARRRPDRRPGGGRGAARRRRANACTSGSAPSSIGCCRAPSGSLLAGAIAVGPDGRRVTIDTAIADAAIPTPRRALLSVSDKTGLGPFAAGLVAAGFELVSTGGTARALREAGLPVTDVAAVTGFPEMLDGRVKTLHPRVHGGILADRRSADHRRQLIEAAIAPFELVVVNLYPFAAAAGAARASALDELVEEIDIGGPSMVRAAAKNHANVAIVTSPARYDAILAALAGDGRVGDGLRCGAGRRGVSPYRRLRRPDRRGPAAADGRGRRPAAG